MTRPLPSPPSSPSRRQLLSLVGAGGFLAATSRARADVDVGDDFDASRRRVVVVGAGVAGLSAAKALQNLGLEVVVLEGQDRDVTVADLV